MSSGSKSTRFVRSAVLWIGIATAAGVILYWSQPKSVRAGLFEAGIQAGSPMQVWWQREFRIVGWVVLFGGGIGVASRGLERRQVLGSLLVIFGLLFVGTYRLRLTNPMNVAYCRGFAAGLDRTVGAGEVRSRLMDLRRLEDRVPEGYLVTNIFPEFSSQSPVILFGPMASSSPLVSYHIAGGAAAISLDGPPRNPGRHGDLDWSWTNGLWISIREE